MTKNTNFPPGWDEYRVKRIIEHYESQSEYEALAEDEAAFEDPFYISKIFTGFGSSGKS